MFSKPTPLSQTLQVDVETCKRLMRRADTQQPKGRKLGYIPQTINLLKQGALYFNHLKQNALLSIGAFDWRQQVAAQAAALIDELMEFKQAQADYERALYQPDDYDAAAALFELQGERYDVLFVLFGLLDYYGLEVCNDEGFTVRTNSPEFGLPYRYRLSELAATVMQQFPFLSKYYDGADPLEWVKATLWEALSIYNLNTYQKLHLGYTKQNLSTLMVVACNLSNYSKFYQLDEALHKQLSQNPDELVGIVGFDTTSRRPYAAVLDAVQKKIRKIAAYGYKDKKACIELIRAKSLAV